MSKRKNGEGSGSVEGGMYAIGLFGEECAMSGGFSASADLPSSGCRKL